MSIKLMTTPTSEDSYFLQLMLPTHGRNLLYSRPTHILIFGVHLSTLSSHVGIIFPGSRNIISFKPAENGQGQSSQLTELYPSSFRCGKNQCCAKPNILFIFIYHQMTKHKCNFCHYETVCKSSLTKHIKLLHTELFECNKYLSI